MYENLTAEELRKQLMFADCDRRDLFFARLLGGGTYSEEEARQVGESVGVTFPSGSYYLLSARPEAWGELYSSGQIDRGDTHFILRNTLENAFSCVSHAAWIQGHMVAILSPDTLDKDTLAELQRQARSAVETLEEAFGISVTIAISRGCHSLMELPRAMEDTGRVFDYLQLIDGDKMIVTYEELRHPYTGPTKNSYLELHSKLLSNLRAADFAEMQVTLHELVFREFSDPKPSIDIFRFRINGLVSTLLFLMEELRAIVGNDLIDSVDPGPRLTTANTLSEIVGVMDDILETVLRHGSKSHEEFPEWVSEVYTYAEAGFSDPDLTVSSISDHFNLTPTYCARLFKEKYHIRLFDFIQLRRMEQAKALMHTDKSLRVIADESGFSSALTMCRAFKRYEGTAPNVYREALQKQS